MSTQLDVKKGPAYYSKALTLTWAWNQPTSCLYFFCFASFQVLYRTDRILSIWNEIEKIYLMVQIKYYRSNSVQTATLFRLHLDPLLWECIPAGMHL